MFWRPDLPYNDLPALPPDGIELETKPILKSVAEARAAIARLDQATDLIPNPSVLINAIPLLEAQASSEIENIVTTTDALFRAASKPDESSSDPAVKETLRYRTAIRLGVESMNRRALTAGTAIEICECIKGKEMGLRKLPGTRIANPTTGDVIYSPPEGADVIRDKLSNWEKFIHADHGLDPIVTMAVAHYQFEAIHPFSDGNGRTGRILNILVLQDAGLLRMPVLYMSRYIIAHKNDYYRLLNGVTSSGEWHDWTLYMVDGVRQSAESTTKKILSIRDLQMGFQSEFGDVTPGMRNVNFLNVLFAQPYVRIANVVEACDVTRQTASNWLDALVVAGVLNDLRVGRDRLFVNTNYLELLSRAEYVA